MSAPLPPDDELVPRLRARDEAAFVAVLDAWSPGLLRLARSYVRSDALADEVVQETWAAVIRGLPRFEGRSSLKTWVYTILANRARTRGSREARTTPLSALGDDDEGPGVSADRFTARGTWLKPPTPWQGRSAEAHLLTREAAQVVEDALRELPPRQRRVVVLRDIEGVAAEDVCNLLDISESNQRVLLHRGRSRLREALARHLGGE